MKARIKQRLYQHRVAEPHYMGHQTMASILQFGWIGYMLNQHFKGFTPSIWIFVECKSVYRR